MHLLISAPDEKTAETLKEQFEGNNRFEEVFFETSGNGCLDILKSDREHRIGAFLSAYDPDECGSPVDAWLRANRPDIERCEVLALEKKDCLLSKDRVLVTSRTELTRWMQESMDKQLHLIPGGAGKEAGISR